MLDQSSFNNVLNSIKDGSLTVSNATEVRMVMDALGDKLNPDTLKVVLKNANNLRGLNNNQVTKLCDDIKDYIKEHPKDELTQKIGAGPLAQMLKNPEQTVKLNQDMRSKFDKLVSKQLDKIEKIVDKTTKTLYKP